MMPRKQNLSCDFVGISNQELDRNYSGCSTYSIGYNKYGYEFRTLMYCHMEELSRFIELLEARIILKTAMGRRIQLAAYPIMEPWNYKTVTWRKQPSFDEKRPIFTYNVRGYSQYEMDITQCMKYWIRCNQKFYGIVFCSMIPCYGSFVTLDPNCFEQSGTKVCVEYLPCAPTVMEQENLQQKESIVVTGPREYYTNLSDVSRSSRFSYFIQNDTDSKIRVYLEVSPDGEHFAKDIQYIDLEPQENGIMQKLHYSRYTRLAIEVTNPNVSGSITTWLEQLNMSWRCYIT